MKNVLKLTLCAVIVFIAMTVSKTVNAEAKKADVKYTENNDGTVKVTMTFSESVEDFTTLKNAGWTLSGKTATKNMEPGEWYIYTGDEEDAESGVVAVPNKVKVNETLTLNDLSSTKLSNLKIADSSFGTVDGKKIKFVKEGKTQYSATATMTYTSSITNKTITKTFDLIWDVIISNDGNTPVTPTNKTATVTYGEPTDAGVLVTVKFSQNIPNTAEVKEKLKDWNFSGNTATRTMKQGAIASISLKYEDGSTESAKVAVPLTLEIGSKVDFSKMATDLKIENTEIATIENGIIIAKLAGETKMTGIATMNNEEYIWTIKVKGSNDENKKNDANNESNNKESNGNENNNNGSNINENGQDSGNQSGNLNNGKDSTTSKNKLAKAGSASVAPIFIVLISITIISFIKYRKVNK